jgi:hypothetical protein
LKIYGPLTIHCSVPGDWYNLQDGSGTGNHEVEIVGYHDNVGSENAPGGGYWIIKNSWGSWWSGDGNHNGYGEIAYASEPTILFLPGFNHDVTGITGQVYFTGAMATVTWNGGPSGTWSSGGNTWSGVDHVWHSPSHLRLGEQGTSATSTAPDRECEPSAERSSPTA